MRGSARRIRVSSALLVCAASVAACTGGDHNDAEFRIVTESFNIRVTADPTPPKSLEQITWTVVVNDKETGRPIDPGEGRIFASSRDGKNIANGFAPTEQVGTYSTKLMFVTAGTWMMGIQFRRDSTEQLERSHDWAQEVRSADEPGEYTLPQTSPVDPPTSDSSTAKPDSGSVVPPSSGGAASPR